MMPRITLTLTLRRDCTLSPSLPNPRARLPVHTAPEAPHITSVDYSQGVLYVRWTYGELFIDLSHSRMLHWQVVAQGKKGPKKNYSIDVSPQAPSDKRVLMALTLTSPC